MCWPYVVGKDDKGNPQYEYHWCQGKVLEKVSDVPPTIRVLWDAMPYLDKDSTISPSAASNYVEEEEQIWMGNGY